MAAGPSYFCLDTKVTKTERSEIMNAIKNKLNRENQDGKTFCPQASSRPGFLSRHCPLFKISQLLEYAPHCLLNNNWLLFLIIAGCLNKIIRSFGRT